MAKILVCDDDKEIVEAIEIYLTQEGYEVLKTYDGMEALKVLESEHVDLLVIDVMMPKLDGIRATLKIREENNMPIIILSAKSEDADKILGLNRNFLNLGIIESRNYIRISYGSFLYAGTNGISPFS